MLNRCSPCPPTYTGDDGDASNCVSCPASMRTGGDPTVNVALDWLMTLVYTFAFNLLVSAPLTVMIKVKNIADLIMRD